MRPFGSRHPTSSGTLFEFGMVDCATYCGELQPLGSGGTLQSLGFAARDHFAHRHALVQDDDFELGLEGRPEHCNPPSVGISLGE